MTVVLGLGNPGTAYENTRHNVGFTCTDRLTAFFQTKLRKRCFRLYRQAEITTQKGNRALIVQPLTYMNKSGEIMKYFSKDDRFVVIVDNMDLACGGLRIRMGGGSSGQKGMKNIADNLGTEDFLRIYIGTGRPHEGCSVNDHVLGIETQEPYKTELDKAIDAAANAVIDYIDGEPLERIQQSYSRKGIL